MECVSNFTVTPPPPNACCAFAARARLVPDLKTTTKTWRKADLLARLEAEHVPASPINSVGEAFQDPQIIHRGLEISPEGVPGVRTPIMYGAEPTAARLTAPKLGEHSDLVRKHGWSAMDAISA